MMLTGYGNIATAVAAVKGWRPRLSRQPQMPMRSKQPCCPTVMAYPAAGKSDVLQTGFAGNIFNGFTNNATVTFPKPPVG